MEGGRGLDYHPDRERREDEPDDLCPFSFEANGGTDSLTWIFGWPGVILLVAGVGLLRWASG